MRPLPHEGALNYITWTGMETDLIFNKEIDLPGFASFPLLETPETRALLADYANKQIALAQRYGVGTILESATWMANRDRAAALGYDAPGLVAANKDAIIFLAEVRAANSLSPTLISANIGPRDDAYAPGETMTPAEAEDYHGIQVGSLAGTALDMVSPYTFSNAGEAIGVVRAATRAELSCVVAFTVETDGCLPSGQSLDDAIDQTDRDTDTMAAYFMVNCAHPTHFGAQLTANPRICGIVVNASTCSHAELDEATSLDDGDPAALGQQVADLMAQNPALRVFGGCCGTDMRHLAAMAQCVNAQKEGNAI